MDILDRLSPLLDEWPLWNSRFLSKSLLFSDISCRPNVYHATTLTLNSWNAIIDIL